MVRSLSSEELFPESLCLWETQRPSEVGDSYLNSFSCTDGEGSGTPLQHSCLGNPMDGGAWWASVYGVAQSWTRRM